MATVTKLIDDINGEDATDTLEFSWGADDYTIDLNDKNAQEFREFMALYIGHATKKAPQVHATGRNRSGGTQGTQDAQKRSTDELIVIRTWANQNGYNVAQSGRIAGNVLTAFDAWEASQNQNEGDE